MPKPWSWTGASSGLGRGLAGVGWPTPAKKIDGKWVKKIFDLNV